MSTLRMGRTIRSLALSIAASAIAQAAGITVTPVVTPNGASFHYNYSITNGTGNDMPVLDIAVKPGTTILNLGAPIGFMTAYDSGLGLVSFLENTAVFGASALSGFVFDSPKGPGNTTFTATFFDGSTTSGATQGPLPSTVPEPASLALFAAGGALLFWRKSLSALRAIRSSTHNQTSTHTQRGFRTYE